MKRTWRKILSKWRIESRRIGDIPKETFPILLKKLNEEIRKDGKLESALKNGFRACGIHPLNRNQVLQKMPEFITNLPADEANSSINDSLIELLKEYRGSGEQQKKKRGKKQPKKSASLYTGTSIRNSADDSCSGNGGKPVCPFGRKTNAVIPDRRATAIIIMLNLQWNAGRLQHDHVRIMWYLWSRLPHWVFDREGRSRVLLYLLHG